MRGETKPSDILKNFSILSLGTFFGKISGLALKVVVARFLGVEILGIYVLLNLIIPYYSYAFLGISYILPREIPQMQVNKEFKKIDQTRSIINIFFFGISLLLTLFFTIYILYFYEQDTSQFSRLNLILVFLTAFFYQLTTLITKHIKSLGVFSKLYINESFIKIFSPLIAIILIIQFGLNGYLFSNLAFAILNFGNFAYYNHLKKLSLLSINYFSFQKLIQFIKLGFAMLISQKTYSGQGILYTLLFTYLGLNFSLETVGQIGFLVSFCNVVIPLFKPYLVSTERIIYSRNRSEKLSFKTFFDISFINALLIGSTLLCLGIILKYIIPLFFIEFHQSILFFPAIALMFFVINSLIIINYYLNGFNIYLKRNIAAIISIISFIGISKLSIFTTDPIFLFLLFIFIAFLYKIILHYLAKDIFKENFTVLKITIYEFLLGILLWSFSLIVVEGLITPILEVGLIILFIFIATMLSFRNPKKIIHGLKEFFI